MKLLPRLRRLDSRLLPGARRPDEDAESYLRRLAASRPVEGYAAADINLALREYFRDKDGA